MAQDLSPEEQALLRSVLRKRLPSNLWLVTSMNEKPLTPSQRESIRGAVMDEARETGLGSERGTALKNLSDRLAQT
ncbi:MAG TPA: hypothetical protein VF756_23370 [Thermoanaerobaculia bacterium]